MTRARGDGGGEGGQELAEGKSLAEMVRDGGRASEAQVRQIAMQLLEVLQYMGSLSPPVIHRRGPAPLLPPQNPLHRFFYRGSGGGGGGGNLAASLSTSHAFSGVCTCVWM